MDQQTDTKLACSFPLSLSLCLPLSLSVSYCLIMSQPIALFVSTLKTPAYVSFEDLHDCAGLPLTKSHLIDCATRTAGVHKMRLLRRHLL